MNPYYPHLFEPITINGRVFKNRIFATPNCIYGEHSSNVAFYQNKAAGGAAVVTLSEAAVSLDCEGQDPAFEMGLARKNDAHKARLGDITMAIKAFGAVPSIELMHMGHFARPDKNLGVAPKGPMAFIRERDHVQVLAMTEEDLEQVIHDYAYAAQFAKRCGFEMVMVHLGHGWLPSQFLSARTNQRTDRWGGSLENRARLSIEICKRIKEYCGRDFIIEARIVAEEYIEGGMHVQDACEFAELIQDYVDLFNISCGIHDERSTVGHMVPLTGFVPTGFNVEMAAEIKRHVNKPISVISGITTPEYAEKILAEGKVDIIGLGRALIADPDFPRKAERGKADEIIHCMRCNQCISSLAFDPLPWGQNKQFGCAANPRTAKDLMLVRMPAPKERRKVVVVGAGPAGLNAAKTAAERGHQVILIEKSDSLGGYLRIAERERLKMDTVMYKDYLIRQINKLGVEIRLNTVATAESISSLKPDVVICACGSNILIPPIKGVDPKKSKTFMDAFYRPETVGKNVIIIGGGIVACEAALKLADEDPERKIHLVEMRSQLCDPDYVYHYNTMVPTLDKHPQITYSLETKCVEVSDNSVTVEHRGTENTLFCDTVILATGLSPNKKLVEELRDTAIEFYDVGDCTAVRKIRDATCAGFWAAMNVI